MFSIWIPKVKESIFPIFFQKSEWGFTEIWVSWTGFFINDNGLFLTAHHVISDIPSGAKILYCWNIPEKIVQPIEIEEVYSNPENDIFLWKVSSEYWPWLEFDTWNLEIWSSVCLCGYPLSQISLNPDKTINVNNVRQYWQPTFKIDKAVFEWFNWRNYTDAFITQDTSLPWMSWWPIFNRNWKIIGMDVATMSRKISLDSSNTKIVDNWVGISISSILHFIESYI